MAASATFFSDSWSSARRPTSVSVFGSPTLVVNSMKSRMSLVGAPSSTSCVTDPMLTFCPCASPWVCGTAVSPLWMACAAASPPDSNPSPDSRVFASMTFSTAGVT